MSKLERFIAYGVLLLAVGFIAWEQIDKAMLNWKAQESAKIQQQADKKIADAMKARDDQFQKDSAEKDKTIADARKTIADMASYANSIVKPQKPILVMSGPDTVTLHQGDSVIPYESAPQFFDAFAKGDKCVTLELPKCQADVKDWSDRYDTKQKEADDWKTAAKGGSFWHRLKNDAIKVGIGVGIGYALKR